MARSTLIMIMAGLALLAGPAAASASTVAVKATGPGSVAIEPAAVPVSCSDDGWCRYSYTGPTMTATAVPAAWPAAFGAWALDCAPFGQQASCALPSTSPHQVLARFGPVTLQWPKDNGGGVTLSPAPQSWCGERCARYAYGTVVVMNPAPAPGWRGRTWSGVCQNAPADRGCRLTLIEPRAGGPSYCRPSREGCIASVQQPLTRERQIKVKIYGVGAVSIVGKGRCARSCGLKVTAKQIAVTAVNWRPGFRWGGACRHTSRTCQFDTAPSAFGTPMTVEARYP